VAVRPDLHQQLPEFRLLMRLTSRRAISILRHFLQLRLSGELELAHDFDGASSTCHCILGDRLTGISPR
jgi:hypothetical protein